MEEIIYEVERDDEIVKVKKCNHCLKFKSVKNFSRNNKTYQSNVYLSYCRKCKNERQAERRINRSRKEVRS